MAPTISSPLQWSAKNTPVGDYMSSEDDNQLVQGVASDVNALGFIPFAYFVENRQRLKLVAIQCKCHNNGKPMKPSEKAVRKTATTLPAHCSFMSTENQRTAPRSQRSLSSTFAMLRNLRKKLATFRFQNRLTIWLWNSSEIASSAQCSGRKGHKLA